jgi:hypothetical protein
LYFTKSSRKSGSRAAKSHVRSEPITEALPAICITTRLRQPVVEGLVRAQNAVVADHARLDSVAAGQLNDIGDDTRVRSSELDQVNGLVWMRALWDEAKDIGATVACDALKIVARGANEEDQAAAA